jgi:predicted dehydrogenase
MSSSFTRRDFIRQTAAGTVGLSVAPAFAALGQATAPTMGTPRANNKLTVAVIGTNGRGLAHIECLAALPEVEIAAVCDVDDRAIAKALAESAKYQKNEPQTFKDFRKLLEQKSIDAVTIATPDHWHAPMAIQSLAAGKHVYVEKPCGHNPHEGELLVKAVRKYNRVLQMGNQRRSFPNTQQAIREIREGIVGRACAARAWYANNRTTIGRGKSEPTPAWLDYELWQGPAPRRPYRSNLIHYNWHWFWHWGTGEALNNGTHEVDVCRWALGVDWPTRVTSSGGRFHFKDDWESPDTQTIGWDYAGEKTITWEGRSCNGFPVDRLSRGAMIFGTEGSVLIDGNNYTVFDSKNKTIKAVKYEVAADPTNTVSASGIELDRLHMKDWVDAIRLDRPPTSPIEEGHVSVGMLHLGNIAWRVQRDLRCDPRNGHIQDDRAAMKLWRREYEPGWEPKV